ncbi:MAG: hypothetical protein AAF170_02100 [Bacteroidota bacterium]
MSPARLSLMAALGLACIASSVFLHRKAPVRIDDVLDRTYR